MKLSGLERLLAKLVILALVASVGTAAFADNAKDRMELIDETEDKLDEINGLLREFDGDRDADAIGKIEDRLDEIEGLIEVLEPIYENDRNATALVKDYPGKIRDFRQSLGYLKLARENQFKVDPIAELCEDEEEDLRAGIERLLAKEDPSQADEIEDLAEDTEDKISGLVKDAANLVTTVDKLLRQAKSFNYRYKGWSNVSTALHSSANKIIAHQATALSSAERGCEDLLLGEAQDEVQDALEQLADLDQAAAQTADDFNDLRGRIDTYLDEVNKIKRADETMLDQLITAICGSDIERDGDTADKLADSITAKAQRKLQPSIDYIVSRQRDLNAELGPYLRGDSPHRSMAGRYKGLLRTNEGTVESLKESVVQGANNPKIRAASRHGQEQHKRMGGQSTYRCDKTEVVAGRGRADCVSIDKSVGCVVWEFKPSTYSQSKAMSQAKAYIPYINKQYKDNPDAAHCFPKGFEAKVASYKACGN